MIAEYSSNVEFFRDLGFGYARLAFVVPEKSWVMILWDVRGCMGGNWVSQYLQKINVSIIGFGGLIIMEVTGFISVVLYAIGPHQPCVSVD
jgi:hypothetical protein